MIRLPIFLGIGLCFLNFGQAYVQAHQFYVYVPENSHEARVVFGHGPKPERSSSLSRIEKMKLYLREAGDEVVSLDLKKAEGHYYFAALNNTEPTVLYGIADVGVTQHGARPPQWTSYYPKTIVGDPFADTARVGDKLLVEINPVRDGKGFRLQVLVNGLPHQGVDLLIGLPGSTREERVQTDSKGLTPVFETVGRHSAATTFLISEPGVLNGESFEAIRHIATLVFDRL